MSTPIAPSPWSRRTFCLSAGIGSLAALLPGRVLGAELARAIGLVAQPAPITLGVRELKTGLWAITEQGGNVLLIRAEDGPVIVDAKLAGAGHALALAAAKAAGRAPVILINTHHHGDHTGGNWAFSETARIIAHEKVKPRLPAQMDRFRTEALRSINAMRAATDNEAEREAAAAILDRLAAMTVDDFSADVTFEEHHALRLGERKIDLHYFGAGHTDNDIIVHLPDENVVHTGDLLFHERYPFVDGGGGGNIRGWQRSLEKIIELCNEETIVIPGHGNITNQHALRTQISFFHTLREIVETSINSGLTKEQITVLEPAAFEKLQGGQIRGRALGAMYDEIIAERSGR